MKRLYTFTIPKEVEVDKSEKQKNEKGEEITITKKVKETKQLEFFLRKATRSLFDSAELFYGVKVAEGIKSGLMPRALLVKRIANDGGLLSESDKEKYSDLWLENFKIQTDFQKMSLKSDSERSKEEKVKYDELIKRMKEVRDSIREIEYNQSELFDQTAEIRARNKTILWWVLNIGYKVEDGKEEPVFGDGTFEEKLTKYDEIEENADKFQTEMVRKLIYYVSVWYAGGASTQEEFEKLLADSLK